MNLFIKKIIFFLLPIIVLAIVTEFALRQIPNEYSFKDNYLEKNSSEIEILVLGNSHSYRGVNPDYFKLKGFNAAMVSQSIDYDYKILDKNIKSLRNLKFLILNVSHGSFYHQLGTGPEAWRAINYNLYYDVDHEINLSQNLEIFNGEFKFDLYKIIDYYLWRIEPVSFSDNGYSGKGVSVKKNFQSTGLLAANRHNFIPNKNGLEDLQENLEYFEKLIQLSKEYNFRIILFTPPALEAYTAHLDKNQLQTTIEILESISFSNSNVYYKNFLEDEDFNESYFYDADHLNIKGAGLLSRKLNHVVETLNY